MDDLAMGNFEVDEDNPIDDDQGDSVDGDEVEELKAKIEELEKENEMIKEENELLKEEIETLKEELNEQFSESMEHELEKKIDEMVEKLEPHMDKADILEHFEDATLDTFEQLKLSLLEKIAYKDFSNKNNNSRSVPGQEDKFDKFESIRKLRK